MTRYTLNQLQHPESPEYLSDEKLLQRIITDRLESTTNPYSPLCERLIHLRERLHNCKLITAIHESPKEPAV